jgi:hypothetical protein
MTNWNRNFGSSGGVNPVASDKQKRKSAKASKKPASPAAGPFRHPDGDRRHRNGMLYSQGVKDKEMLRLIGAVELPPEEEEERED